MLNMNKQKNRYKQFAYIYFLAPLVGLEPTTYRLTAERSTNWAKEEYKTGDFLFSQQGNS